MVDYRLHTKHILLLLCYAAVLPFVLSILSGLILLIISWVTNDPTVFFPTVLFVVHVWGVCFFAAGIILFVAGASSHGGHADAVAMGRSGIRTEAVMRDTRQDALEPRKRKFSRASLLIAGVLLLVFGLILLGVPIRYY